MQSTHLQIALHRPPEIQQLKQIQGVEAVEVRENNRFYIQHTATESPAEALVEKSVAGNWGIYELIPEDRSLEQVFMTLMGADEVPPDFLLEKGENVTLKKGEGTLENGVNLKKMNGATVKVNSIVEGT